MDAKNFKVWNAESVPRKDIVSIRGLPKRSAACRQ